MELYYAHYQKRFYSEFERKWLDGRDGGVIVVADTISEARQKVERCLPEIVSKGERSVLLKIVKCVGLNAQHGFEDSFYLDPISDETNEKGGE